MRLGGGREESCWSERDDLAEGLAGHCCERGREGGTTMVGEADGLWVMNCPAVHELV